MVVSGLPVRIPDHSEQIATMALDLLHQSGRFKIKHLPEVPLQLRIGLHTGYFRILLSHLKWQIAFVTLYSCMYSNLYAFYFIEQDLVVPAWLD